MPRCGRTVWLEWLSGAPVRSEATTSWIARIMATVWVGSLTRSSCVAPGSTRCRLLVDSAAILSWRPIHPLELSTVAVGRNSGFGPEGGGGPAPASEGVAVGDSSREPPHSFPGAAVARASARYFGGRSENWLLARNQPSPTFEVVAIREVACFKTL